MPKVLVIASGSFHPGGGFGPMRFHGGAEALPLYNGEKNASACAIGDRNHTRHEHRITRHLFGAAR
jgi:hypothetical protein